MTSRSTRAALLAATALLLMAFGVLVGSADASDASAAPGGEPSPTSGSRSPHVPIRVDGSLDPAIWGWVVRDPITGEVDWTLTRLKTGVVSGAGTQDDPYVIEGWTILPELAQPGTSATVTYGIDVRQSSAHFVVRNTDVTGVIAPTLTGFSSARQYRGGIHLSAVSNATLEDVEVNTTYAGILIESSSEVTLRNCVSHHNTEIWPLNTDVESSGIKLTRGSRGVRILDCTSHDNEGYGLRIDDLVGGSSQIEIVNLTVDHNGVGGVSASYLANASIQGCAIHDNGRGLTLSRPTNVTLTDCDVYGNAGAAGIDVYGGQGLTVSACRIHDNAGSGVLVSSAGIYGGNGHTVMDCEIRGNVAAGIDLYGHADGNTFTRNRVEANGVGIRLRETTSHETPRGNLLYDNAFLANTLQHARDYPGADENQYNVSKTSGLNLMRGPYVGGNYWSDYNGLDLDGDGLGDTSVPWGPGDRLPLFAPGGPLNRAPSAPTGPSPSEDASGSSPRPRLSWSASTDPDGDAVLFDVWFGADAASLVRVGEGLATPGFTPGDLAFSTTYSWRVVARDAFGAASEGPVWSFSTRASGQDQAPHAPFDASPPDGATDAPTSPALRVSVMDPDADRLDVTFYGRAQASGEPFTRIGAAISAASGETASVSWDWLAYSTTFEWYAVADDGEAMTTSPTWTFTTKPAPAAHGLPILAPHPQIKIVGNAAFTAENGVTSGSGTREDAFVLEGWDLRVVTTPSDQDMIEIKDTTAYFVIRNVYAAPTGVNVEPMFPNGIVLDNVQNGMIEHVLVEGPAVYGILLMGGSTGNTVRDCEVAYNGWGVALHKASGNTVEGCDVHDNGQGILAYYSPDSRIRGNRVNDSSQAGVVPWSSPRSVFRGNTLLRGDFHPATGADFYTPDEFDLDMDESNTVDGKPICYAYRRDGVTIDATWASRCAFIGVASSRDVTIHDVTLDSGLLLSNVTNATLTRCDLQRDLASALALFYSTGVQVSQCSLHDSYNGLFALYSDGNSFSNVTSYENIHAAYKLSASHGNTLRDCTGALKANGSLSSDFSNAPSDVLLWNSDGNRVERCTLTNAGWRLQLRGSSNNAVVDVVSPAGADRAMHIFDGSSGNTISRCRSTEGGLFLDQADGNTIEDCHIQHVRKCLGFCEQAIQAGIFLDRSTGNVLRRNVLEDAIFGIDAWYRFYTDLSLLAEADFLNDVDASNTVDGKPIRLLIEPRDLAFDASTTPYGYLGVVRGQNVTIRNVTLDQTTGYGVALVNTTDSLVEGCDLRNMRAAGVALLFGSRGNTLRGCSVGRTAQSGVLLYRADDNLLEAISVSENEMGGVVVKQSSGNVIRGCVASRTNVGIYLDHANDNRLEDCASLDNGDYGIAITGQRNLVTGCAVRRNQLMGIVVGAGGIPLPINPRPPADTLDNQVSECVLDFNTARNVHVGVSAAGTRVAGNDFLGEDPDVTHGVMVPAQAWNDGQGTLFEGNFWSDHANVDADGDGRADAPYVIYGGRDNAPSAGPIAAGPAPIAAFTHASTGRLTLQFTDRSLAPDSAIATWSWDYGDGNGSTLRSPTHAYAAPGSVTVRLTVVDDAGRAASAERVIEVAPNRAPALAPVGDRAAMEGELLSFVVRASDADADPIALTVHGAPEGASFDAGGQFAWTPTRTQAGSYLVRFAASDGLETAEETIVITVANAPSVPPVLAPIGDQATPESVLLAFQLHATDADGDEVAFAAVGLPAGASLDATSGAFAWTPTHEQAGWYLVTFVASDGALTDEETITLRVADVDRPPVLSPLSPTTLVETQASTVPLAATDPDGDLLAFSAKGLPSWATLVDAGDGTGRIELAPPLASDGSYAIDVTVRSKELARSGTLRVTVLARAGVVVAREGPGFVETAAPRTLLLRANLTNTGHLEDTLYLAAVTSAPWGVEHARFVTLAPGETTQVELVLRVPENATRSSVTLTATSQNDTSAFGSAAWSVAAPLVVTVEYEQAAFSPTEPVRGVVRVAYVDGTPIAGAAVSLKQWPLLAGHPVASQLEGVTNATGAFAFDFGLDALSRAPGRHVVLVSVTGAGQGVSRVSGYDVAM